MNMKLEVVIVPVSDVDRAKAFYEKLGFRLDIDIVNENFRGIQFTPPRSAASIIFGKGVTSARSGSADLVLAVDKRRRRPRGLDRPRRQRHRDLPLRRRPLQQCHGEPARVWARPARSFLLLVCLVRGSRREPLVAPGDHGATSRPRMETNVRRRCAGGASP